MSSYCRNIGIFRSGERNSISQTPVGRKPTGIATSEHEAARNEEEKRNPEDAPKNSNVHNGRD
jgi:hypothetical protein